MYPVLSPVFFAAASQTEIGDGPCVAIRCYPMHSDADSTRYVRDCPGS